MENINKQAELYAESFRYKVDDRSWYEQKKRDFIAGYEAKLRIQDVSGRSELLIALQNIEKICDNQNPTHEQIWRLAHEAINSHQRPSSRNA